MAEQGIDLSGRVALVTGSARRFGRVMLDKLAAAGASVVVNSRADRAGAEEAAAEIERMYGKGRALVWLADITDEKAVQDMIDGVVKRYGRLDILINNANARKQAESRNFSLADWRLVLQTALDGAYLCSRAAAPHLAREKQGRIVNMAGVTAHIGSNQHAHVVTAKAGLVGLTRALAIDLGPQGITVNCVSPALILSDDDPADRRDKLLQRFPLKHTAAGRTGSVEELANAVLALCGPSFSYMTGQVIHVNGGAFFGS